MNAQQPELPPSGWYPNPEDLGGPRRWWTGTEWSDIIETPMPPPPPGVGSAYAATYASGDSASAGMPTLGQVLGGGWKHLKKHWKPVLLIAALFYAPPTAAATALLPRYLRYLNRAIDAMENDEPTISLAGTWWILLVALAVTLVMMIGVLTSSELAVKSFHAPETTTSIRAVGPAVKRAIRRWPAFIAWSLLLVVAVYAVAFVLVLVTVIAPVLIVIGFPLALMTWAFIMIKAAFLPLTVIEQWPKALSRSAQLSRGRFWPVTGHLVVIGLIAITSVVAVSQLGGLVLALLPPDRFQQAIQLQDQDVLLPTTPALVVQSIINGLVFGLLYWGFAIGALTALYRPLSMATPD